MAPLQTETALLRVMSDVFAAAEQRVTLLGLFDLSAAFDHNILLLRLERVFGLSGLRGCGCF